MTLRLGTRLACWATMRMPSCWPRKGLVIVCGSPPRRISPASDCTAPVRMRESVLLPAPFSPTMACTSPLSAVMSTERSACVPPKRLLMPLICRSAVTPGTPRSSAASSARSCRAASRAGRLREFECTHDIPTRPVAAPISSPVALSRNLVHAAVSRSTHSPSISIRMELTPVCTNKTTYELIMQHLLQAQIRTNIRMRCAGWSICALRRRTTCTAPMPRCGTTRSGRASACRRPGGKWRR